MRLFAAAFWTITTIATATGAGLSQEKMPPVASPPRTFAIETYTARGYNYLDNMVDKEGFPYFDVFWTKPAEAAHDWPDIGDVMGRQWQTAILSRHLTGKEARNEKLWAKTLLALLDAKTGLIVRPPKPFWHSDDPDDERYMSLDEHFFFLYALVTAYADSKDPAIRDAIAKMIDHLPILYSKDAGFFIKDLMTCVRQMDGRVSERALIEAGKVVKIVFDDNDFFTPDNKFRQGIQMHGSLRTLMGAADYALYVNDPVLFSRVDALYRYARSQGTRFGFLPENVCRKGDVILCETCALMDFVGLAATLANNGHPEYWGDVERMVRNHLVESQVADVSWLKPGTKPDDDQFTWRDVGARMVGGYAGWSSPTHILAARETLHWGSPELRNKTRAFQNCCGGSGTHGFYIAWKNASRFQNGTLSVNLHIDKLLPEAEIRCYQPYQGRLTIDLKRACQVRVRIPEFIAPGDIQAKSNAGKLTPKVWGNYLELGDHLAGTKLEVTYPLELREETETIGNPGFRQYQYRVAWIGDTVVRMTPIGTAVAEKTGFSDFEHKQVEVFYGSEGPGPLYQREAMLRPAVPTLAPLHMDDGQLDFWTLREKQHNPPAAASHRVIPYVQALADQVSARVDFFDVAGCPAFVIRPNSEPTGVSQPWVWYAPVIDNPCPDHAWMLRQWLAHGIGMAGVDVGESFGNPKGRAVFNKLWETLRQQYHMAQRPCLFPQSRGGLMLDNWAAENPSRVACIAGMFPVCDLRSFPRLERACGAYGLTAAELAAHLAEHNPIDRLAPLAHAGVPILHVHGDADRVVPLEPNSSELARRYRALGGNIRLIVVPGQGHQVSNEFFHSQALVDFVIANARVQDGAKPGHND